jgi:branched-chain amino acid aminotransferase
LAGVTRDSALTVLKEMGLTIEERPITIDELMNIHKAGKLNEVFGTGTAATISLIKELRYKDYVMQFDTNSWKVAPELKNRLNGIRYGTAPDVHGWMYKI